MNRLGLAFAVLLLTSVACGDDADESMIGPPCGDIDCMGGEYCCDVSCGLCVEDGVVCPDTCP